MKYIKKYEGFDNPRIPELKKLLSHLIKVFSDMGYDYNSYLINNDYQTNFLNDNKERVFDIGGDFSRTIIIVNVTMRTASTDYEEQIPQFFKTIGGLKLYREDRDWYTTSFEIVDNVDNIIKQITKENFEMFINSKKYNL